MCLCAGQQEFSGGQDVQMHLCALFIWTCSELHINDFWDTQIHQKIHVSVIFSMKIVLDGADVSTAKLYCFSIFGVPCDTIPLPNMICPVGHEEF